MTPRRGSNASILRDRFSLWFALAQRLLGEACFAAGNLLQGTRAGHLADLWGQNHYEAARRKALDILSRNNGCDGWLD